MAMLPYGIARLIVVKALSNSGFTTGAILTLLLAGCDGESGTRFNAKNTTATSENSSEATAHPETEAQAECAFFYNSQYGNSPEDFPCQPNGQGS